MTKYDIARIEAAKAKRERRCRRNLHLDDLERWGNEARRYYLRCLAMCTRSWRGEYV